MKFTTRIDTRTPILTKMVAMSHALDPSRNDTQALLDPGTAGDVGGATNTLLDVWGDNYNVANCLTAMTSAPTKSGLLTEMGTETSTWATVMANPGLTGEFMWTGVDYLGEADGEWPTVGCGSRDHGRAGEGQERWLRMADGLGRSQDHPPPTGTTASKLVVTADHSTLVTDVNDIVVRPGRGLGFHRETVAPAHRLRSPSPSPGPAPSSRSTAAA